MTNTNINWDYYKRNAPCGSYGLSDILPHLCDLRDMEKATVGGFTSEYRSQAELNAARNKALSEVAKTILVSMHTDPGKELNSIKGWSKYTADVNNYMDDTDPWEFLVLHLGYMLRSGSPSDATLCFYLVALCRYCEDRNYSLAQALTHALVDNS